MLVVPFASTAGASVGCPIDHCYSLLYDQTRQYGGLQYQQNRGTMNNQTVSGYEINSEAWFANHCFYSSATWVELGIQESNSAYQVFWQEWLNGKFKRNVYITSLPQNNVVDSYEIMNNGDGRAIIWFDSIYEYTDTGFGFNGSCLEEGGELYTNDGATSLFNLVGGAFTDGGSPESWGTGQTGYITHGVGLAGKQWSDSEWSWQAP